MHGISGQGCAFMLAVQTPPTFPSRSPRRHNQDYHHAQADDRNAPRRGKRCSTTHLVRSSQRHWHQHMPHQQPVRVAAMPPSAVQDLPCTMRRIPKQTDTTSLDVLQRLYTPATNFLPCRNTRPAVLISRPPSDSCTSLTAASDQPASSGGGAM